MGDLRGAGLLESQVEKVSYVLSFHWLVLMPRPGASVFLSLSLCLVSHPGPDSFLEAFVAGEWLGGAVHSKILRLRRLAEIVRAKFQVGTWALPGDLTVCRNMSS